MVAWALGRLIAAVLAFVAVILFAVAIWNAAAQSAFLNPETYKQGLADQNIYADIVPVVLPALSRGSSNTQDDAVSLNDVAQSIGADNWRAIANDLVPPDWLQQQAERAIDLAFAWVNGDTDAALTAAIDLKPLRERLTGEQGKQAIDRLIRSAPPCTDAEIEQLKTLEDTKNGALPICQPPEAYLTVTRTVLSATLNTVASQIQKDQYSLADVVGVRRRDDNLKVVSLGIQIYQQLSGLTYLCPAAFIALMVAFAVRSFKGFGRWAGLVLVLAGLLAILPLPFISFGIVDGVSDLLVNEAQDPEVQLFQLRLATGLVGSAFGQFSSPVVAQGALFVGAGFVLWIITMIVSAMQRPPTPVNLATANQPRTVTIGDAGENQNP